MSDVHQILQDINRGERQAAEKLLPLVYHELRRLAERKLAQEKPGQTLNATALVHEAYLRLIGSPPQDRSESGQDAEPRWDGQAHFFAVAAEAMRRILVENARRKQRAKHGGGRERLELEDPPTPESDERLLRLDQALSQLAGEDSLAARVVELRHFAGLGHEEIARALGITVYRARQKWTYARAWLRTAMKSD